jgi:hypothetical protein
VASANIYANIFVHFEMWGWWCCLVPIHRVRDSHVRRRPDAEPFGSRACNRGIDSDL